MFGDTRRGNQKPSIEDKTINWLNEKGQIRIITKLPNFINTVIVTAGTFEP
jgi:hypothetical protein